MFVPKGLIDNKSALVQIMAQYRTGDKPLFSDKPLSEPIMAKFTEKPLSEPIMVKFTDENYITIGQEDLGQVFPWSALKNAKVWRSG